MYFFLYLYKKSAGVVEKKSVLLIKDGKAAFIQDHRDRCRDQCSGVLQCRRKTGFNSK